MNDISELRERLASHGQEHLLQFWDELSESDRCILTQQLNTFNLKECVEYFKIANATLNTAQGKLDSLMEPIPNEFCGSANKTPLQKREAYWDFGLKKISENKVGVLLMAGGQGTRLGVNYPKGMYDVGLPSHKTLFQIQAERILRLQYLAGKMYNKECRIRWYIMTSDATMDATLRFFQKYNYFGLKAENVIMFEQGMLPCYDNNGKIILDTKCSISKSPDGNGGLYRALRDNQILSDMEASGVKYLHAYCVDNILVRVADPMFLGYCIFQGADCGAKVVEKDSPSEPVGVVCQVNGIYQVVEYSEVTQQTAERRREDGGLVFNAGNICNHFFTTEFLKQVADKHESKLKLHIAKKKIPYVDNSGVRITPDSPNGLKIEKFVFDVFPFAKNFVTWEVPREEEFSALKNNLSAEKNTPLTSREDVFSLHRLFVKRAGGLVDDGPCEISPLISYAGEDLEELCAGKTFTTPLHLSPDELHITNGTNGYH